MKIGGNASKIIRRDKLKGDPGFKNATECEICDYGGWIPMTEMRKEEKEQNKLVSKHEFEAKKERDQKNKQSLDIENVVDFEIFEQSRGTKRPKSVNDNKQKKIRIKMNKGTRKKENLHPKKLTSIIQKRVDLNKRY